MNFLRPGRAALLPLLLTLTVVTGLVDAVSYLDLGHVFVANMTGNVVFLGFAVVGAPGLQVAPSLVALAAFLLGALAGGRLGVRYGAHRGRHLSLATTLSATLITITWVITWIATDAASGADRYLVIVLLALAMGMQNATSRRIAVPDATTTVLTLTLTGLAADSPLAGGSNPRPVRRIASVLAMLLGALVGALIVLHTGSHKTGMTLALALAAVLLVSVAALSYRLSRNTPAEDWTAQPS